jgi:hypothetical protein
MGPNGMVARHDLVGVYATQATRQPRDIAGEKLQARHARLRGWVGCHVLRVAAEALRHSV